MKLFHSVASPYARKVMACAITREIDKQITLLPTAAFAPTAELLASNPLSKIPCLITADGMALFDSPVICEYLDSIDGVAVMFPPHGGARWRALKQQAMGDGILDAAIYRRIEGARQQEAERTAGMARQHAAIARTLDVLERDVPHKTVDIGSITVSCALGYLDFRFGHEPWRPTHPRLADWFAAMSENPGISRTVPREPS